MRQAGKRSFPSWAAVAALIVLAAATIGVLVKVVGTVQAQRQDATPPTATALPATQAIGYETYMAWGQAAMQRGEYDQAIDDLGEAIAAAPAAPAAYYQRARAYAFEGNYVSALDDLDRAIELAPNYAEAYYYRGATYAMLNMYEPAVADLTQALALVPQFPDAYHQRGRAYFMQEAYERAFSDYTKALELRPDCAECLYDRALVSIAREDYAAAEGDLEAAVALVPIWGEAYYWLGNARYRQDKFTAALKSYDRAIEQLGDHAPSYQARGLTHRQLGHRDQAVADLEQVLALSRDPYLRAGAQAQLDELDAQDRE